MDVRWRLLTQTPYQCVLNGVCQTMRNSYTKFWKTLPHAFRTKRQHFPRLIRLTAFRPGTHYSITHLYQNIPHCFKTFSTLTPPLRQCLLIQQLHGGKKFLNGKTSVMAKKSVAYFLHVLRHIAFRHKIITVLYSHSNPYLRSHFRTYPTTIH